MMPGRGPFQPTLGKTMPDPGPLTDLGIVLALITLPLLPELPVALSLYLIALYLLYLGGVQWPWLRRVRLLPSLLMIGGIALVFGHYHTLIGYQAGIAFYTLLLPLKLLEIRQRRDFHLAVILGSLLVVLQFLLNQPLYRSLYMVPLLAVLFGLLVQSNQVTPLSRRAAFYFAVRLIAQGLPLMLVLFIFFPRLNGPLWSLKLGDIEGRTGLGKDMAPGSINRLTLSQEPAFRAEFQESVPANDRLYWRGPVFWSTDGLRWFGSAPKGLLRPRITQRAGRVTYREILEPHGKHWVLALDLPSMAPKGTRLGADFQVSSTRPIDQRTQFFMRSFTDYRTGPLSPQERAAALQRPPTVSERMVTLVEEWKRRAGGIPQGILAQALAFFRQEGFIYTLTPPLLGPGGMETFLFETHAGFCEHYASSFALLMRLAGIPSRVVTGYLGGEYNELGNYYLVREADAHAWSEIWLADAGWVRVDPTAAVAPERIQHSILTDREVAPGTPVSFRLTEAQTLGRILRRMRMVLDALNTRWHMWVLGYDTRQQVALLRKLGIGFLDRSGSALLMIGLVVALMALIAWILMNRRGVPPDVPTRLYRRLCMRLARIGLQRHDHEGPQDFARRVACSRPDLASEIETLIALYIRLHYSQHGDQEDQRMLARRLRGFHPKKSQHSA